MERYDHLLLVLNQEGTVLPHIVECNVVVNDEVADTWDIVEPACLAATNCLRAHLDTKISDQKQALFNDFLAQDHLTDLNDDNS